MTEEARMAQNYKALKEGFVSNLSGGGVSEINIVTAVAPVRWVDLLYLRELTDNVCRQQFFSGRLFKVVKASSSIMALQHS